MLLNRYLSMEVFFAQIGHGALFWLVIAILAIRGMGVRGSVCLASGDPSLEGRIDYGNEA